MGGSNGPCKSVTEDATAITPPPLTLNPLPPRPWSFLYLSASLLPVSSPVSHSNAAPSPPEEATRARSIDLTIGMRFYLSRFRCSPSFFK